MRKWAAGLLVLAAAVLFYVACGDSPTSPGTPGATTTSGPFGPSSGPFGPSSGPFGPSSGPFGPSGGGGGGGGGGTATPTATPGGGGGGTATPTPTSTVTLPCPATFTFETTTPQLVQNNDIPIPTGNFGNECVVDKAIVSIFARTTDGSDIGTGFFGAIDACGAGPGFSGCGGAVLYRLNNFNTGALLGTSCYDLIFDDAAALPFDESGVNTPPPYSGTWQWPETQLEEWYLNSTFDFHSFSPPTLELQCLKVVFITKIVVP